MKVYGLVASQPVRAVLFLFEMKGVEYELVQTMPPKHTQTAEFLALNPTGKKPSEFFNTK